MALWKMTEKKIRSKEIFLTYPQRKMDKSPSQVKLLLERRNISAQVHRAKWQVWKKTSGGTGQRLIYLSCFPEKWLKCKRRSNILQDIPLLALEAKEDLRRFVQIQALRKLPKKGS